MGRKSRYRRARHVHRAPDGTRLVLRLPGAFSRAGGKTAAGKAHCRSRLPRQRLYRAGLSAHFRRTACAGCASELLFADRLFRRRQKDDRGIPRAGAKSSPERAAPVRARPDAQAPEGNEGCHWSCKRAGLLSGRRGFLQRYAGDGSAVCGLAEAGRRHGGGKKRLQGALYRPGRLLYGRGG